MLLPFVRLIIVFLLMLTTTAFVSGVARIHMAILSALGGGLLLSLSFFESEYKKAQSRVYGSSAAGGEGKPVATTTKSSGGKAAKTD